jgi:hypothetical protein
MWATRQPAGGRCRLGIHGTSVSITMTRSASASSGPGSVPKCIEWSVGSPMVRGAWVTTGTAQRSASRASGATASAPVAPVMISGRAAAASHFAKVAIVPGSGCGAAGSARGGDRSISPTGALNGSRGRIR